MEFTGKYTEIYFDFDIFCPPCNSYAKVNEEKMVLCTSLYISRPWEVQKLCFMLELIITCILVCLCHHVLRFIYLGA